MTRPLVLLLSALALSPGGAARAAASTDDARQLGAALTEVGAERAGNADGSIPAYAGGLTRAPAGFDPARGTRPDPFEGERPLFSVDARDLDRHAGRLTEGVQAMLRRYPGLRIDVYPTHRTVAFPEFVTRNTVKLATSGVATNGGHSFAGVRAAYPFPVPKSGYEAMWNHLVRFSGVCARQKIFAYVVEPSGAVTLTASSQLLQSYPYWEAEHPERNVYFRLRVSYEGPPRRAGEAFMLIDPVDSTQRGRRSWQYVPGLRRVRLAPDLAYDTPNAATAGAQTFDEALLFNGALDRFDFTLQGKRELYVPYNTYRAVYGSTAEQLLRPHFLEPDRVRWELHRVWVVEARLKPEKRHVYSRRVFYLDEDSWAAVLSDEYDARGQIYRVGLAFMTPSYDLPGPWADPFLHYDLVSGAYAINGWPSADGWVRQIPCPAEAAWSPDALAGAGIR